MITGAALALFALLRKPSPSTLKWIALSSLAFAQISIAGVGFATGIQYWRSFLGELTTKRVRLSGLEAIATHRASEFFPVFDEKEYYIGSQVQLGAEGSRISQTRPDTNDPSELYPSSSFTVTNFSPRGTGGMLEGQKFTFGEMGKIAKVDAFLKVFEYDLSGQAIGRTSRFSVDPLPQDINYSFSSRLSDDGKSLILTYGMKNTSLRDLANLTFFFFVDPEIGSTTTLGPEQNQQTIASGFNDEYGVIQGSPGKGALDADPDSWEIDEPGYLFGNIKENLLLGQLDDSNSVDRSNPEDVAFALGFDLGTLPASRTGTVEIMLSTNTSTLSNFHIQHIDQVFPDILTISGHSQID